ncbi:flagellar hook-basal body protein [Aciduricibacillus chroicocephali]|uniref:Flagellar hook-basal body protein n=1 Tax=Aciduricibacillus chroicocephali TaxID=3054939 RepID=A0ABY9KX54_9BACI|nr:flagellar hook-basal body protein [Bacillaceae bacterium 44XB]
MSQTMIQAAVTMGQLQNKLDLIGNNLANTNTAGYKGKQSDFSSLLYREINNLTAPENAVGRLSPDMIRTGTGARLGAISLNMSQGTVKETGRTLDAALNKKNLLFQVQQTRNGNTETLYTRDGSFYLNPANQNGDLMLVTKDGDPVLGKNGPIVIQPGFQDVAFKSNGDIVVTRNGEQQVEGQLDVVEAVRPRFLESASGNMFRLPESANANEIIRPIAGGDEELLTGGALEMANVDIAKELTDMTSAQRAYSFNARTLTMGDQMEGLVNQLR